MSRKGDKIQYYKKIKFCRSCKKELNKENWNPGDTRRGNYICRQCDSLKTKEYNRKNPELVKRRLRRYWQKLKREILNHFSNGTMKCAKCDENRIECLSIDHINNNGAEERRRLNNKGGGNFYRWLRKNNYPKGYQVLCWNCNAFKAIHRGDELNPIYGKITPCPKPI